MRERYFDNAATTPLDPRVFEEMLPYFGEQFGNAHSIHTPGLTAMHAVDRARERVARLLGAADPSQITFTSGATESNNWILHPFPDAIVGPFEHSSIHQPAKDAGLRRLSNCGYEMQPAEETDLASIMTVNNEVGTIWNAAALRGSAKQVHSDITQAAGKLPLDLAGIDYASLSGHKFYGPKGVGALYAASTAPQALILGGNQEQGLRSGTLNVPGIVGLGAASAIAMDEMAQNSETAKLTRSAVLDGLRGLSDFRVNGGPNVTPYILSLSFLGVEGESLVVELDRGGYSISGAAACSSRSTEPSHVLVALGLGPEWLTGTIRISFGKYNRIEDAQSLANLLRMSVEKLRTMH